MSRELISSEKFPPKPHNSPASKVPGLIFCAGQTATGEIKQATVSLSFLHLGPSVFPSLEDPDQRLSDGDQADTIRVENRSAKLKGGS